MIISQNNWLVYFVFLTYNFHLSFTALQYYFMQVSFVQFYLFIIYTRVHILTITQELLGVTCINNVKKMG